MLCEGTKEFMFIIAQVRRGIIFTYLLRKGSLMIMVSLLLAGTSRMVLANSLMEIKFTTRMMMMVNCGGADDTQSRKQKFVCIPYESIL